MKKNGYRPTHRNRWLFLQQRVFSPQALLLLEFLIDQMDFDPRHVQFGTCEINFLEISQLFGCKSTTTPRNWLKELLAKGFLAPTKKKSCYSVSNPERYIVRGKSGIGKADVYSKEEANQNIIFLLQSITHHFQSSDYVHQPIDYHNNNGIERYESKALSSSKVESHNITPLIIDTPRGRKTEFLEFGNWDRDVINALLSEEVK